MHSRARFFIKNQYQIKTAEFVASLVRKCGYGKHDINFSTGSVMGNYSFTREPGVRRIESQDSVDLLCLALEKTHQNTHNDKEYLPGYLTINTYGFYPDGTINGNDVTLRAYHVSKEGIDPVSRNTLETMYKGKVKPGTYKYADAWTFSGDPTEMTVSLPSLNPISVSRWNVSHD
jgi:hypothetical protein